MKVSVFGAGYVGLVTAGCLADIGNEVICLDIDNRKLKMLQAGIIPFFEPGLPELVARNFVSGRLRFSGDVEAAVHHGEIIFIATGTPAGLDGSADLESLFTVARDIAHYMQRFTVVVQKSTAPVGTTARLRAVIEETFRARPKAHDVGTEPSAAFAPFDIVANPEFLKQGDAIGDFMRPDRIVIGSEPGEKGKAARDTMFRLYAPLKLRRDQFLNMNPAAAELTKYGANAMLATRISFVNELANLAESLGVDIDDVRRGIGSDARIGMHYLQPGIGYGGSCLPKDVRALIHASSAQGLHMHLLKAVQKVNEQQPDVLVEKIVRQFGEDLRGLTFCVWGLAFKAGTDDMRETPSRVVIKSLLVRGAEVVVHDPSAMDQARLTLLAGLSLEPDADIRLRYADTPIHAAIGADALVVLTDWDAYRILDLAELKSALRKPLVFDGRNLFDPSISSAGFVYHAIGR
ncbi:UDPglucose 6-dehydrogenase [Variovorax sp. GrIS 2.14]|uniref:UDP-glucose dehydrogenase family protein n=1 Tax=Variovorax sp. GrIS 2.14 TaxID=3071709 RepID=UPI0038F8046E